jgi:hypothetical protein
MSEPPEAPRSTDEGPNATEPVRATPESPSDGTVTVNVDADPEQAVGLPHQAEAFSNPQPATRSTQRPPRTPQVLTAAVLVLIVVSIVIFAIEVATQ